MGFKCWNCCNRQWAVRSIDSIAERSWEFFHHLSSGFFFSVLLFYSYLEEMVKWFESSEILKTNPFTFIVTNNSHRMENWAALFHKIIEFNVISHFEGIESIGLFP